MIYVNLLYFIAIQYACFRFFDPLKPYFILKIENSTKNSFFSLLKIPKLLQHMFASSNTDELIKEVRSLSIENIGVTIAIAKESLSLEDFMKTRLGLCSRDEELTSYAEFKVSKITRRVEQPVRRLLCLSETCIIERDLATYAVICATPLKHVRIYVRKMKEFGLFWHRK